MTDRSTRVDFHGTGNSRSFAGHITFEGELPFSLDLQPVETMCFIDGRKINMTLRFELDTERATDA